MPRTPTRIVVLTAIAGTLALSAVACGGTPSSSPASGTPTTNTRTGPTTMPSTGKLSPETGAGYTVDVQAAGFPSTAKVDNPYFPLVPGTRLTYQGSTPDGPERTVVEVTKDTRAVLGVRTVVVHDTADSNGKLAEDTYDWYAQDKAGNVWYFGEATRKLDANGQLTDTEGSWESGVNGAQPGLIMKARPAVGDSFYQEFLKGKAEDRADVIKLRDQVTVPYRTLTDTVRTKDYSALDTTVVEQKVYAKGIGLAVDESVVGPPEKSELVSVEQV